MLLQSEHTGLIAHAHNSGEGECKAPAKQHSDRNIHQAPTARQRQ